MEYKLLWSDGKGEFEITGDYDYVTNEWRKVISKYHTACITWWGHEIYGGWVEISQTNQSKTS